MMREFNLTCSKCFFCVFVEHCLTDINSTFQSQDNKVQYIQDEEVTLILTDLGLLIG